MASLSTGLGALSLAHAETTYSTNYVWDANRRLVMTIQPPDGAASSLARPATRYVYDVDGQLTGVEIGRASSATGSDFVAQQKTAYVYDTVGNNTQAKVFDGVTTTVLQQTQTSYDADHRQVCVAVRMNTATFASPPTDACTLGTTGGQGADRITKTEYDLAGQVLKTIRAYGTSLQQDYATNTYSDNGQLVTVKDARGNRTTLEYDDYDRPVKLRYPVPTAGSDASSTTDYESYGYDANSNKTSVRKRDGVTIAYTFDALNRQILKDMPGTADDVYSRLDLKSRAVFDRFGGLTGDGIDYQFDLAGRQTSVTAYGRAMSYQYDAAGDRTRVIWQDGFYVQYGYDALGRVTTIGENGATSGAGLLGTYTYDDLGRRKTLTRGNGVVTTFSYDGASRLSGLVQDASGTTRDQTFSFSYNPAGQATLSAGSNAVYDWAPPSVQTAKTYNGLNQDSTITALGGYDAKGNLTNDGIRAFTYDPENRLLTAAGTGLSLTLSYDPLGRLRRTVSSGTTTEFIYDATMLTAEYDGTGALLRRYVHGPGTDEPLVWYEGSTTSDKRYLVTDRQGSVIGQADGSGAVTQAYTYGSYGEPGSEGWGGSRFRYTGQTVIPEAQLYYYKARFYDPIAGRFLQTDPIGTKDDLNLYAYVGGDPLNRGDPTGLFSCARKHKKEPAKRGPKCPDIAMASADVEQANIEMLTDLQVGQGQNEQGVIVVRNIATGNLRKIPPSEAGKPGDRPGAAFSFTYIGKPGEAVMSTGHQHPVIGNAGPLFGGSRSVDDANAHNEFPSSVSLVDGGQGDLRGTLNARVPMFYKSPTGAIREVYRIDGVDHIKTLVGAPLDPKDIPDDINQDLVIDP